MEKCVEERHSDILNELESKRRAANEMSKKNKQLNASLLELTLRAKELIERIMCQICSIIMIASIH